MEGIMQILEKLRNIPGVTVEEVDTALYSISIPLGDGFAGEYAGGLWGDVAITNDSLVFNTTYGDVFGEGPDSEFGETFGEGTVLLDYVAGSGLAYAGPLDDLVGERLRAITGGLISASGSEQGMQGEDYLSLDVYEEGPAV
jgi:hypothetical protein